MTDPHPTSSVRPYSGRAVVSLAIGLASLVLVHLFVWLGIIVAVAAVIVALMSRRELQARSDLRGFGFSLAGFLAGAWVLLINGVPLLISITLVAVAWPR
jgi:hypothetical protein